MFCLVFVAGRKQGRKKRKIPFCMLFKTDTILKRIEYILMQPFWLLACFCIQTSHTFTLVKHHFTFSLHDFFSASLSK